MMDTEAWRADGQDSAGPLRPVRRLDGFLRLGDYGLIGDGATCALVGRDGSIDWLCLPRFDAPPLFCALLDNRRGGTFSLTARQLVASRQWYAPDTAVLVTELQTRTGRVRIHDALLLHEGADLSAPGSQGRGELLRRVEGLDGKVELELRFQPRGGCDLQPAAGGLRARAPEHPWLDLRLHASMPLAGARSSLALAAGDVRFVALRWGTAAWPPLSVDRLLDETARAWRAWTGRVAVAGPRPAVVRRSAITLKLLHHADAGAPIAAATSSLPEALGGPRNWDYRYVWIRDAAFTTHALRMAGFPESAEHFLEWLFPVLERHGGPRVLYTLDGRMPPPEHVDPGLAGYRHSMPVRWGNGADGQIQHDAYGEILDAAWQQARSRAPDARRWLQLRTLVETARRRWRQPDQGIWEVRTQGRVFTYSAALCQVALDRGARLAERFSLPGRAALWQRASRQIQEAILTQAWSPRHLALAGQFGGDSLDASVLALPLRKVIAADDPRMVASVAAIQRQLGAGGGLLHRYLPEEAADGLAGGEGAFLICSFWLVDNLALQGRLDEAEALYASLCDRGGALGLLPEEIEPSSGLFLGNYPQAFSHLGVILSAVNLERARARAADDAGRAA